MNKSCRTCKFFPLTEVMDAAKRVRRDRAARCLWKAPDIDWPDSMGMRVPNLTPQLWMQADDGKYCLAWVEAEK